MKGCIRPFPKKGDLGLVKNYRGITFTSICNIPMIRICETCIECSHHIYIERRNPETRKITYDFLVQERNFLLPLSLKVLRHKERDTYSFYSGFSICPHPSRAVPVVCKFVWPLRARKVDPFRSVSTSQLK